MTYHKKNSGFSLIEMLVSLGLSLFLVSLLIKIYFWHIALQHKIDDMLFLDHNGVIAMQILADNLRSSQEINIRKNELSSDQKIFLIKNKTGLFIKEIKNHQPAGNAVEIVLGVRELQAHWQRKNYLYLRVDLTAPHDMSEIFSEQIKVYG